MKQILLSILLFLPTVFLFSQENSPYLGANQGGKGIIYNKEFAVELIPQTNGFAVGFNLGKIKTYYKTTFYHLDLGQLRHVREFRQSYDLQNFNGKTSRPFIYGKTNSLYVVRGAYGVKKYFSEKAKEKGLAIGMTVQGGPSLGFLKPYSLELIRRQNDSPTSIFISTETYSENNKDIFLDPNAIYGGTGFTTGWKGIKINPGLNFRTAVLFDWGAFDEFLKSAEVGVVADFYFLPVPIMVTQDNSRLFLNFYLNLQLGKRN